MVTADSAKNKRLIQKALNGKYDHVCVALTSVRPEHFVPKKQLFSADNTTVTYKEPVKLVFMVMFEEPLNTKVIKWKSLHVYIITGGVMYVHMYVCYHISWTIPGSLHKHAL